jgi:predicted transcriptional regulator
MDAIHRIVVPHIWQIISSGLSARQREVITLYFLRQLNQVSIAKKLGISQPTVSQHLNGKRRKGKKIGGSIKKIKKLIRNMASTQNSNSNEPNLIRLLSQLLDKRTGYRESSDLLRSILK